MGKRPVVVVGAGLAGLACARALVATGREVVVLEAADAPGGRVRSDVVDGFVIDRGFQVLNTAYPALRREIDLDRLDLRRLPRGARVRRGGRLVDVPHPLASPAAPWRALASGAADVRGKVALARYVLGLLASSPAAIMARDDRPAVEVWREVLPAEVVDDVLVPFFAGVVLDPQVATSRVFADLMMRCFARGWSAVPARGMQRLPDALAADLPAGSLRLGSHVSDLAPGVVGLVGGAEVAASAVVLATDSRAAHDLLPALGEPPVLRGVRTFYFAADPWPGQSGTLVVDADGSGVATSVVLTASAPEYAADGRSLIATSVIGPGDLAATSVEATARALHEAPAGPWELVAVRDVPHALPAMPAPHAMRPAVEVAGLVVAGDHRATSSIQGALASGRRAARAVLARQ